MPWLLISPDRSTWERCGVCDRAVGWPFYCALCREPTCIRCLVLRVPDVYAACRCCAEDHARAATLDASLPAEVHVS